MTLQSLINGMHKGHTMNDDEPNDDNIQPGEPKRVPSGPARRERDDVDEDHPRRRRPSPADDAISTVIPFRNGLALAGYYLGVFSLIPCLGAILGPLALVFGVLGFRYVKKHPEAKGTGHAITAIVLGSLTTLAHIAVTVIVIVVAAKGK
ncbi:MAG: hypothetical protein WCL32_18670 [Planctomycetota bacterium]